MTGALQVTLLLMSCRSEQPLDPRPPRETEDATVETWTGTVRPIDGVCIGEPPEATCEPTHLTTPKTLNAPRSCETRSDCLPTEFCGAGACRVLEGERGTLCFERVWVRGTLCGQGDRFGVNAYVADRGSRYPLAQDGSFPVDITQACWAPTPLCVPMELGQLLQGELVAEFSLFADGEQFAVHGGREEMAGPEFYRGLINSGCHQVRNSVLGSGSVEVGAHLALWYP